MNTTETTTNVLDLGEIVQHDGYSLQEAGTIKLGRTTYTVKIQRNDGYEEVTTWLHGPRGGAYLLQSISQLNDTGIYRAMSLVSGKFLHVRGNEVRVLMLGNLIEVAS